MTIANQQTQMYKYTHNDTNENTATDKGSRKKKGYFTVRLTVSVDCKEKSFFKLPHGFHAISIDILQLS